eukprot:TRINITY_DN2206_c0_g1_i1.p1 TRINITY_DN2206_c0_g1~~TRINITY_DN2206_c0_g1_i1.p1  ORF type:complete len:623 (-),score=100.36 TRINITY_DN2206_c0_g1_i1:399-2267(-)
MLCHLCQAFVTPIPAAVQALMAASKRTLAFAILVVLLSDASAFVPETPAARSTTSARQSFDGIPSLRWPAAVTYATPTSCRRTSLRCSASATGRSSVKAAQLPTPTSETRPVEKSNGVKQLQAWAEENSCSFSKTEILEIGGVRGAYATQDIEPGEVLVQVPAHLFVTMDMGAKTEAGAALIASNPSSLGLQSNVVGAAANARRMTLITLVLLDELQKGEASFFRPYLNVLPENSNDAPAGWGKEARAGLRGSALLDDVEADCAMRSAEYDAAVAAHPPLADVVSRSEFLRVYGVAATRTYLLPRQRGGATYHSMVPVADMLNHERTRSEGAMARWRYAPERGAFIIAAKESVPAGSQIFISYGWRTNKHSLLDFGFVHEHIDLQHSGVYEGASVAPRFALSINDPLLSAKVAVLATESPASGPSHGSTSASPTLDSGLVAPLFENQDDLTGPWYADDLTRVLSMARVAAAEHQDWETILAQACQTAEGAADVEAGELQADEAAPHALGVKGERAALRMLLGRLQGHLEGYPTTLEEDTALIHSEEAPARWSPERSALVVVRGEKQILHAYADFATRALEFIEAGSHAAALEAIADQPDYTRAYCLETVSPLRGWGQDGSAS